MGRKRGEKPTVKAPAAPPKKTPRPRRAPSPFALPDPHGDDFAYQVALLAWRDGLTTNAIARRMGLPPQPLSLMWVKRALRRAHNHFLKLLPRPHHELQERLVEKFNKPESARKIAFHVVDDLLPAAAGPVFVKAAQVVAGVIVELARTHPEARVAASGAATDEPRPGGGDVIICNAGGRTVSETVKVLLRDPPLLDISDEEAQRLKQRLMFVAANAAYLPRQFHHSANFLSVTMAGIFGAERHFALPRMDDANYKRMHRELVGDAALFICSAGDCESSLMAHYFKENNFVLPAEAVGDLAFNLLDRHGDGVALPPAARQFLEQVNPTLDLARLMHIAANNRVILILDAAVAEQKALITSAVLARRYATDVVLGAKLARAILKSR